MTVRGVGIHSGAPCTVHLLSAEGPIRFLRDGVEIPAALDAVASTQRCTSLAADGAHVAMVEHVLAALRIAGWWRGVVIEVSGPELPILDGSAEPWMEAIAALGVPPPAPAALEPEFPVVAEKGLASVRWEPGADQICCHIAFDHPAIGPQSWCGGPDSFGELLPARTFGFVHEAEKLRRDGLAQGASTENAIVFTHEGPMRPLRTPHEPVRHKALDLLGDLFLLQRPLAGRVTATRGSHALHIDFMRILTYGASVGQRHAPRRTR